MKAKNYLKLDDAIINHLTDHPGHHPIYAPALILEASLALGRSEVIRDDAAWRLIDRRLQALKKSGKIGYVKSTHQWMVLPQVESQQRP